MCVDEVLKQLIDLTRDDPIVYAIITALPDVNACIAIIPMLRWRRKHFEANLFEATQLEEGTNQWFASCVWTTCRFVPPGGREFEELSRENPIGQYLYRKVALFEIHATVVSTCRDLFRRHDDRLIADQRNIGGAIFIFYKRDRFHFEEEISNDPGQSRSYECWIIVKYQWSYWSTQLFRKMYRRSRWNERLLNQK